MTFTAGSTLTVREVWAGETWLLVPELVGADDPTVLATLRGHGTPLTFPVHPGGPHPPRARPRRHGDLRHVLEAAASVTDLLYRGDLWWSPWEDWVPGGACGTMDP